MYKLAQSARFRIPLLSAMILASMVTATRAESIWNHNGSTMSLNVDRGAVVFSYLQPRSAMAAQGVQPGAVLFSGHRRRGGTLDDWSYSGTAYLFSARCGTHTYTVEGSDVYDPLPKIVLKGIAPRINQQDCSQNGEREDTLTFEYQLPDLPGLTDATCNVMEFGAYRECLERTANSICQGRIENFDQARCFRYVTVVIYRNSGIGGYAKDLAEGSAAPFTDCRGGYCKFSGGGSQYTCTRTNNEVIKECDGDNCADVSCPIRRCKWICGAPNE
jgi:hypothetical protein